MGNINILESQNYFASSMVITALFTSTTHATRFHLEKKKKLVKWIYKEGEWEMGSLPVTVDHRECCPCCYAAGLAP